MDVKNNTDLNVGDTVRIISASDPGHANNEEYRNSVGKVGTVTEVDTDGEVPVYEVKYAADFGTFAGFYVWYYLRSELEKGHIEFVSDEGGCRCQKASF